MTLITCSRWVTLWGLKRADPSVRPNLSSRFLFSRGMILGFRWSLSSRRRRQGKSRDWLFICLCPNLSCNSVELLLFLECVFLFQLNYLLCEDSFFTYLQIFVSLCFLKKHDVVFTWWSNKGSMVLPSPIECVHTGHFFWTSIGRSIIKGTLQPQALGPVAEPNVLQR